MTYLNLHRCLAITLVALAGCNTVPPDAHMAAFSTQMTGQNQVPPVSTPATGRLVGALDKNTLVFRWKLSYSGLSGPASAAHFHGPAAIGANARISLAFTGLVKSPYEGRAILTATQAADLLAGKWYASIHTPGHPSGEIRGQLTLRE